jgi:hypothetical protein
VPRRSACTGAATARGPAATVPPPNICLGCTAELGAIRRAAMGSGCSRSRRCPARIPRLVACSRWCAGARRTKVSAHAIPTPAGWPHVASPATCAWRREPRMLLPIVPPASFPSPAPPAPRHRPPTLLRGGGARRRCPQSFWPVRPGRRRGVARHGGRGAARPVGGRRRGPLYHELGGVPRPGRRSCCCTARSASTGEWAPLVGRSPPPATGPWRWTPAPTAAPAGAIPPGGATPRSVSAGRRRRASGSAGRARDSPGGGGRLGRRGGWFG